MINFIMIAFSVMAGMIFRHYKLIPADAHKGINVWILSLALPAVSFKYLPKIEWSQQMLFPILSVIIIWIGAWLCMEIYCKRKGYKQRSRSTLELSAAYSNTSFIGFPLILAYFSEKELSIAIVCDQAMFILLSTAGIINAVKGSKSGDAPISAGLILKRLFIFPPFIGCFLALVLSCFVDLTVAEPFFDKLVATVGPLALFSIGLQLKFNGWKQLYPQISMAMFYKLLIAPALVLVAALVIGVSGNIARITIFEAAMPTLVTSSIISEQYHLNTKLVNLTIGASIVVGLVTTAIWQDIVISYI